VKQDRDASIPAHVAASLAHLTGTRGPLRSVFDRLRRYGFGERVLKSALAVSLSWELASLIPNNPNPVLAAMTGMFSINLTIAGSVRDAVQRVFGVIWGVAVALGVNAVFGLHGWSLALVVVIAFAGGQRIGLGSSGLSQMAVSALLIVLGAVGTQADNVAWLHFVNTIVGTVIGIALNAVIAPPNYLPEARTRVRSLGERIVAIHEDLAHMLSTGLTPEPARRCLERAREIAASVEDVHAAIVRGEESLQYHLFGSAERTKLAVYHRASKALEFAAVQTRVISRAIYETSLLADRGDRPSWIDPGNLGRDLADVLSAVSVAIDHFVTLIDAPRPSRDDEALTNEVFRSCERFNLTAQDHIADLLPNGWTLLGEVIALSEQLVSDLSVAANEIGAVATTTTAVDSGSRYNA
jgi:hypothetical protein